MIATKKKIADNEKVNRAIELHINSVIKGLMEELFYEAGEDQVFFPPHYTKEAWNTHYLEDFFPPHYPVDKVNDKAAEIYEGIISDEKEDFDVVSMYFINALLDNEIDLRVRNNLETTFEMSNDDKGEIVQEVVSDNGIKKKYITEMSQMIKKGEDLKNIKKLVIQHGNYLSSLDNFTKEDFR